MPNWIDWVNWNWWSSWGNGTTYGIQTYVIPNNTVPTEEVVN